MANNLDADETTHDEPSHKDLKCLDWYLFFLICRDERVKHGKQLIFLFNHYRMPAFAVNKYICGLTINIMII